MQRIKDALDIAMKRERNRGTLWASVQARRVIEFYYHGGYRTVEPYALGVTRYGEADNESLICYQLSGFSELNDTTGWKLYRASEMEEIKVSREQFTGDRSGYDPDSIDMAQVYCCVRPGKPAIEIKGKPILPKIKPLPVAPAPRPASPKPLTHNDLMQRFRFSHPLPGTESSPPSESPPRSVESKTWPLKKLFDRNIVKRIKRLKTTVPLLA